MAMRCRSAMTTGEPKLFRYILELGKYDMSYDVRDKTRLLRSAASTRMRCTQTVRAPARTAACESSHMTANTVAEGRPINPNSRPVHYRLQTAYCTVRSQPVANE